MRANFAPGGFRDYFQYQTISSYISGNDAVCSTAGSYSISGLPAGAANFTWEVGPHLEIVSGSNTNNPQIKASFSSHRDDWILGSFTTGLVTLSPLGQWESVVSVPLLKFIVKQSVAQE